MPGFEEFPFAIIFSYLLERLYKLDLPTLECVSLSVPIFEHEIVHGGIPSWPRLTTYEEALENVEEGMRWQKLHTLLRRCVALKTLQFTVSQSGPLPAPGEALVKRMQQIVQTEMSEWKGRKGLEVLIGAGKQEAEIE